MNQELDYADMLEIPVSTLSVVKKKSFFKRKSEKPQEILQPELPEEEIKERVVESVNERVGAYVYSEDVSDSPKPEKKPFKKDKARIVLFTEAIAIGAIAVAIFLTNIFMPNSAINTFIGLFTKSSEQEPAYTDFTLTPVVSARSGAEVSVSESGVISFTAEGSVYPVCEGKVSTVYAENDRYTVEIAHTSTFSSVVTGLTTVYPVVGDKVKGNVPVGYSNGEGEIRVSMYDSGNLLNCYTISGVVPVWNS